MSLLTAKKLLEAIQPMFPNGLGNNRFFEILPLLPYIRLPKGRRKYFDIVAVEVWLRAQTRIDQPLGDERIQHRRRPRLK